MLEFSANNPYPIIDAERVPYREVLRHSRAVDHWLGLDCEKIERVLVERGCRERPSQASFQHQQLWFGLDVQSLLTPYVELRTLLSKLNPMPGQSVVDLGAAYGRLAFVLERHHPGVHFVGYEYVGERVSEVQRVWERTGRKAASSGRRQMIHADLTVSGFVPELADFYFLYDYGTQKAIEKTLFDLRALRERSGHTRAMHLIARGRHCRMLIESRHSSWLSRAFPMDPEGRVTIYHVEGAADMWQEDRMGQAHLTSV